MLEHPNIKFQLRNIEIDHRKARFGLQNMKIEHLNIKIELPNIKFHLPRIKLSLTNIKVEHLNINCKLPGIKKPVSCNLTGFKNIN